MELAVHFPDFTLPGGPAAIGPTLAATARAADQGGCAAFTLMDHYFQMEQLSSARDPMLEGYATAAFLAGVTERLRLGLLVSGVTYRHPGLLAKIATTLDVLSGGRAMLGIGAAWYEREHHGLGVPFPSKSERFERLEEALQICLQMWSPDDGPFEGRHYRLAETVCVPRPIQQPHPPVLVGGSGERKTLRLVARYADACNLWDMGKDQVARKINVLHRHCDEVERDPAEVRVTLLSSSDPFDPGFVARMADYAGLGVAQVWVNAKAPDPVGWTEQLVEKVVPSLADL